MNQRNEMRLTFDSRSANEAFARSAVAAFAAQLDPTLEELADIKTALSEAVTNCIIHAYPDTIGKVYITAVLEGDERLRLTVADKGVGIADVKKAMEPLFTTGRPGERAGLGFAVMGSFMEKLRVRSVPGRGTRITMEKTIAKRK